MKAGIIQSNYIPWRGYFDFIDDVDVFVFYDDVPFGQGKKWRNRNRIKTGKGLTWLTVPLRKHSPDTLIQDVEINYDHDWQADHVNRLRSHYQDAPFLHPHLEKFEQIVQTGHRTISRLNVALCRWIMDVLDIRTELRMSEDFGAQGDKIQRPVDLLRKAGATAYLCGPTAQPYTDLNLFREYGIDFAYKSYDYGPYPQLWGDFQGAVSILDLIFNTGPQARDHLKSLAPNQHVPL
jgi:hypothetical protein